MADEKQLIAKLKLSVKEAKTSVQEFRRDLQQMYKEAKAQHDEKLKLAQKEIEQQQKLKEKAEEVIADIRLQADAIERKLKFGKQDVETRQKLIKEEKQLLNIQEAQLKVLELTPKYHNTNLDSIRERIRLQKAELALQETKMRAGLGMSASPIAATAGADVSTAKLAEMQSRMTKLQGTYAAVQARTGLSSTNAEIAATEAAYKRGEILLKDYVSKQSALYEKAHQQRLNLIESDVLAQTQQIRHLEALGKKTKEEADLEVKIVNEKNKVIEQSENQRYQQQMRNMAWAGRPTAQPAPAGYYSDAARMAGLQAKLVSIESGTIATSAKEEMAKLDQALHSGKMKEKAYVAEMTAIHEKLFRMKISQIAQEKAAREAALRASFQLGKMSEQELLMQMKIVEAEFKKMEAMARTVQAQGIAAAGATASQVATMGAGRSFMKKALGFGAMMIPGGGMALELTAAIAAGTALERVLEKVGARMRDILTSSSGSTEAQLERQFTALSKRQGEDPEESIKKLKRATRGLVDDTELYRMANTAMQSGMKITNDQMVKLTGNVVKLSLVQGRDATQAMQGLQRYMLTGRAIALAMALGIDRTALSVRGLSQSADPAVRKQKELEHVLEVTTQRAMQANEPLKTYSGLMKMQKVAVANFFDEIAKGIINNAGFQQFIGSAATRLMDFAEKAEEMGRKIGNTIGEIFGTVGPIIDLVVEAFRTLGAALSLVWNAAKLLVNGAAQLIGLFTGSSKASNDFAEKLMTLHGIIAAINIVIIGATTAMKAFTAGLMLASNVAKALASGDLVAAKQAFYDYANEIDAVTAEADKKIREQIKSIKEGPKKPEEPRAAGDTKKPQDPAMLAQLAKLDLAIKKALEKEKLELTMERIKQEQNALKRAYEQGSVSIREYIQKERSLAEREHQAKLADIKAEGKAKLDELNVDLKYKGIDPKIAAKRRRLAELNTNLAIEKEQIAHNQRMNDLDNQLLDDMRQARMKYVQAIGTIDKAGIQDRERAVEYEYQQGRVGAEDYIAIRKQLIDDDLKATLRAIDAKAEAEKNNQAVLAALEVERVQARIEHAQKTTEFERKEEDVRLQTIRDHNETAKGLLESRLGIARTPGLGSALGVSESETIQLLQKINDEYLRQQQNELQRLESAGEAYGKQWFEVAKNINSAVQEQYKLNQELQKSRQILDPLASLFGVIGQAFGSAGIGETLGRISGSMRTISQYQQPVIPGQRGGMFGGVYESFSRLIHRKSLPESAKVLSPQEKLDAAIKQTTSDLAVMGRGATQLPEKVGKLAENIFSTAALKMTGFKTSLDRAIEALQKFINKLNGVEEEPNVTVPGKASEVPLIPSQLPSQLPVLEIPERQPGEATSTGTAAASRGVFGGFVNGLGQAVSGLFGFRKSTEQASKSTGGFSEKFGSFAKGIENVVGQVGGFISSITGAKSGGSGALSGIMSGFSMGMSFGGPIGGAIMAGVGGILGGLTGSKVADMQKKIDRISTQLEAIKRGVQDGSLHMGDAIQQLSFLRGSALDQAANMGKKGQKKGGRSQMLQLATAINTELGQLIQQQKQLLDQMHEQIDLFTNPQPYQEYVSNLEQILSKYRQFVDAASGTASEMAAANQYLVLALKNYEETLGQQELDNQTKAIQNAIQLNDLLKQRNDLEYQHSQQVFNIMNQGVLTRTYTGAQTKASQLAALNRDYELSKQNLDAQIAVAQDRYDQEKKIFNLATTRVDLEAQLIEAQKAQTTYDIQRIRALQQVVNMLKTIDLSSLTNLEAMFQALGLQTPYDLTQFGLPDLSKPRYQQPSFSWAGISYTFVKQVGGWDLYKGSNGAYVVLGPDGQMHSPQDVGVTTFAKGGDYEAGQPRIVGEAGPEIDIPSTSGTVLPNSVVQKIAMMHRHTMPPIMDTSGNQLDTHSQIYDMAAKRAGIEMSVVKAQTEYINKDMQRIRALTRLSDKIKAQGGTGDLETLLSRLYNIRGRYGAGGFAGETL